MQLFAIQHNLNLGMLFFMACIAISDNVAYITPLNIKHLIKQNKLLVKILRLRLWLERKPAYTGGPQDRIWEALL